MNKTSSGAEVKNKFISIMLTGLVALFLIVGVSTQVWAEPSSAPVNLAATAGDGQVLLNWDGPGDVGELPLAEYVVEHSISGDGDWVPFERIGDPLNTSETVDNLTNGTAYDFRVIAVNEEDESSEPSDIATATPMSATATAPLNLTATASAGQVSLGWDEPSYTGATAVIDYAVEYSTADDNDWHIFSDGTSTATSAVITGLSNGTEYDFRVAAVNSVGPGTYSDPTSATPFTVPDAPTVGTATSGNGQAGVTFTAPAFDGGSGITSYTVTSTPGSITASGSSSPITVTGLTNGTAYTFTVVATNEAGDSGASAATSSVIPATTPNAPAGLSVAGGVRQVALSWAAPSSGGSAISDYTIEYSLAGANDWQPFNDGVSTDTSATVTGLSNGTEYDFRVAAVNSVGPGSYSATSTGSTHGLPGAPTSLSATAKNAQVELSWIAPASNGGSAITGYRTEYKLASGSTWEVFEDGTSTTTTIDVDGLVNGTEYDFRVIAITAVGGGSPGDVATSTPYTVPGAPTGLSVDPGVTQVELSWIAPASNGGSAISDYTIEYSLAGANDWQPFNDGVSTDTSATVTGLSNGTEYDFRVAAINTADTGPYSQPTASTPRTIPDAPTAVSAVRGDSGALVSFSAPAFNGGAAITGYTVTSTPGSITANGSSSPITVTGLTNGTAYTFMVVATNVAGNGESSVASNSVVPGAVSSAPISLVATPGNSQVKLTWLAPASDGGSAITDYIVEYKLTSDPESGWTAYGDEVSTSTSAVVMNLDNGVSYSFRVSAVNEFGPGANSTVVASTPHTTPSAPISLVATPGNSQVELTWLAPASDGGSAITDYIVEYKLTSDSTWQPFDDGVFVAATATVDGLDNGLSYDFRVTTVNVAGDGDSAMVTSIPRTVSSAPTVGTATRGNQEATVTFSAPASNGGSPITSYTVTSSPGGFTATGTNSPITVTGLENGASYTFTVVAINAAGSSPASTASNSITPATVPGVPVIASATPGNQEATVTFSAPASNGGSPITSYTVTSSPGSLTGTSAAVSPITVSGLQNGVEYTFTIAASNDVGSSDSSSPSSSVTPYTNPGAPTSVSAVRGDGQAVVSFVAPSFNGGSAITGYTVTSAPEGVEVSGANSPITVTGLTNGTEYTFTVVSTNNAGDSLPSGSSTGVTPGAVPGAPTGLSADSGDEEVSLSWTAPVSDGGSGIIDYVVEYKLSSDSGSAWTEFSDGVSTDTSAVVTGLVNGSSYDFRVSAVNESIGVGSVSLVASSTPAAIPAAPTGLTASPDDSEVSLSWMAPANGGSVITDYTIEYRLVSGSAWTEFSDGVSTDTSAVVTGLVNGSSYNFRVNAVNAVGPGSYSSVVTATPDLTYPVIFDIKINRVNDDPTVVNVVWSTDIIANSQVEYGEGSSFGFSSPVANSSGATDHLVTITELQLCTGYSFRVVSESLVNGGRAVSGDSTFTTTGCPEQPEVGEEETIQPGDNDSNDQSPLGASAISVGESTSGSTTALPAEEDTSSVPSTPDTGTVDRDEEDGSFAEDIKDVDKDEDSGSSWPTIGWIIAGIVGAGAVFGVTSTSRRTGK